MNLLEKKQNIINLINLKNDILINMESELDKLENRQDYLINLEFDYYDTKDSTKDLDIKQLEFDIFEIKNVIGNVSYKIENLTEEIDVFMDILDDFKESHYKIKC